MVHGVKPDHDDWSARGYRTETDMPEAATVIICVPRSKEQARGMLAEASRRATLVIVDGQKTDGVDSLFKACRSALGDLPTLTKAHGRSFWFAGNSAFDDWAIGPATRAESGFFTTPGVFSDGSVDRGSALLGDALPRKLPKRMADFGAGWGYLASRVLENADVVSVDLIEAERLSLECARLNVTDPRAGFHWADATRFKPELPYGGIVMNPPFHTGRAGTPELGRAFIAAAAAALTPSGTLWMVANRHLPYETALNDAFREVTDIGGDKGFKLFAASRPKRRA